MYYRLQIMGIIMVHWIAFVTIINKDFKGMLVFTDQPIINLISL